MLSPFEESVPPLKYGGTELVIYNLTEQLVKMGHEVVLLATGDSKTSANLEITFPEAIRLNGNAQNINLRNTIKFIGIGRILDYLNKNNFDIVHNHIGWRMLFFEKLFNFPMVTTLHGPLDIDYQQMVYDEYKNSNYISISLNQRKPMPHINFVANVYNGIEIEKFQQNYNPLLGRMSPEKGPLQAIEIAKKAGVKLIMAAKVDTVDQKFFDEEISHLIDGEQIQFIGEVNHGEKVDFLKNAKALIAPIQWEEPFGLFFTEAMICGTPVIAMKRGSVPEIIIDKETGFICESVNEAAEKIKDIQSIDRKKCYEHVRDNFSSEKMMEGYVGAYEKVLGVKK
ncbi:MAG: Glycosyltransferase [Candidatus Moranbacteria bacterium GW2011_GWF1_34_10]|nr:MAG: Glycosyltransferase [Candidatus Moranbacteria bacterium GW2011_GWF1_34_10]